MESPRIGTAPRGECLYEDHIIQPGDRHSEAGEMDRDHICPLGVNREEIVAELFRLQDTDGFRDTEAAGDEE